MPQEAHSLAWKLVLTIFWLFCGACPWEFLHIISQCGLSFQIFQTKPHGFCGVTSELLYSLGYIDLSRFKVRGAGGGGKNQEWIIGEGIWGKVTFFLKVAPSIRKLTRHLKLLFDSLKNTILTENNAKK